MTVIARTLLLGCLALGVACGPPTPAPSPPSSTSTAATINPARIDRVRHDLPAGYESGAIDQRATPISLWGFGSQWVAEPAECAALAAPAVDPGTSRGWSASGAGGIVYAAVVRTAAPSDPWLVEQCGQWSFTGGHTSGAVSTLVAPVIYAATTAGMAAELTTVVEGGTETHMHADLFTADLGDYHCFVTVVTDPGSPNPALGADVAADLLVKTVSALRG